MMKKKTLFFPESWLLAYRSSFLFVSACFQTGQAPGSGNVTIVEDVQGTTEDETCSNRGVRWRPNMTILSSKKLLLAVGSCLQTTQQHQC